MPSPVQYSGINAAQPGGGLDSNPALIQRASEARPGFL